MEFEKDILEAYVKLQMKPRGDQVKYINEIIDTFLNKKKKIVVLSAPTGTGKSIIGAVVAEVLHQRRNPTQFEGASFLATATNMLGQQYLDTFGDEDQTFVFVKGASNYECGAMSLVEGEQKTAEDCQYVLFKKTAQGSTLNQFCDPCEYRRVKARRLHSRHLILNYAYYFTERMGPQNLPMRTCAVFDEAHLINDLYTEFCSVKFNERQIETFKSDIEKVCPTNQQLFKQVQLLKQLLVAGKVNDTNYEDYLQALASAYYELAEAANSLAERNSTKPREFAAASKLARKYGGAALRCLDFVESKASRVFDYTPRDPKIKDSIHEINVKPIFVGTRFNDLINSEFVLLMSATITERFVRRTLSIAAEDLGYIRLPPQFNPANKKVIFFRPQVLNMGTMAQKETIDKLCNSVVQIVKHHTAKGERGLILAPSFALTKTVAEAVRNALGSKTEIFEHVRGAKLAEEIEYFKDFSGEAAVFLTPSGFEGLDLPGDLSRFQILLKAPFASLGDRRIKTIADSFPDIYQLVCLTKIVQGAGRSVRGPDDYATTYILDSRAQSMWKDPMNEWKPEFQVSFKSTLDLDDE